MKDLLELKKTVSLRAYRWTFSQLETKYRWLYYLMGFNEFKYNFKKKMKFIKRTVLSLLIVGIII